MGMSGKVDIIIGIIENFQVKNIDFYTNTIVIGS